MSFERLRQTHAKLAAHAELSDDNKEAISKFLNKHEEKDNNEASIQKDLSSFNQLAQGIDFNLLDCEEEDVRQLIRDLNSNRINDKNSDIYSEVSKIGMRKTIRKFYRWLYEDVSWMDEKEDIKWLSVNPNSHAPKVDPEELLKTKHVKEFIEAADSIRDKALIWTLWSSGARIGGLVKTNYPSSSPLTWRDVRFDTDKKLVKLDIDDKTGDPDSSGPRTVPSRQLYPVLKKMKDRENPDSLDEPVFKYSDVRNYCPKCGEQAETKGLDRGKGTYQCKECSWEGDQSNCEKKRPALTDSAVRSALDRLREKTEDIPERVKHNPHAWRKSFATFKASVGWNQSQICKFFGWVEGSKEAAKYIRLAEQDLEKALFKEYGDEEAQDDLNEDLLKPLKCKSCGELNSIEWSFCRNCDEELDPEFKMHNESGGSVEDASKSISNIAATIMANRDKSLDEIMQMIGD